MRRFYYETDKGQRSDFYVQILADGYVVYYPYTTPDTELTKFAREMYRDCKSELIAELLFRPIGEELIHTGVNGDLSLMYSHDSLNEPVNGWVCAYKGLTGPRKPSKDEAVQAILDVLEVAKGSGGKP